MLQKLFHGHTAICIVFGLLMIWNPEFIPFAQGKMEAIHVSKLYGIMSFVFGIVCYQIGKEYAQDERLRKVYLSFIAFYLMTGFYFVGLYRQGFMDYPVVGSLCLLFGGLFVIAYMNEIVGKRQ